MIIISGGQTGADRGALEAAQKYGVQTGGYAPKWFMTEKGSDLTLKHFNLLDSGLNYVGRTALNAKMADITLWFGEEDTLGYAATKRECRKVCKPFVNATHLTPTQIVDMIMGKEIINIAGNRESLSPGIQKKVFGVVYDIIRIKKDRGEI